MEIYSSEQEQVEAIKKWWDENGKSTLITLVVVLVAVGGWRWWQGQQHTRAGTASMQYQVVLDSVESNPEQAVEQGRALLSEQPGSTYAELTSLLLARAAVDSGDLDGAAAHLRRLVEGGSDAEIKALATLRLARILLSQDKADEARTLIEGMAPTAMPAMQKEVLGDILLAAGDRRGARTAYANALMGYQNNPAKRELMQMKIDDLADVKDDIS